ncbi:MAG: imidazole glycerol phosphate synthase subunit HisF [Bacteroidales bacterium]|nr:imidazole glycerol phosphate synthase subunit HisF [Bacteroidales bacterium]
MFRPRVIPILLLKNLGLVKSTKFKDYRYIGDPINAVKIFNDLRADELVFLDIEASKLGRKISLEFIRNVGDEANMPFAVGGGIRSIQDIKEILNAGAEKVVLNTVVFDDPDLVRKAADEFGSSTIVVSIDVKKKWFGKYAIYTLGATKNTHLNPFEFVKTIEQLGAGEIIVNAIDRDGLMNGFDIDIVRGISDRVSIPVVAVGGAGNYEHLRAVVNEGHASAIGAGSMFVYHGNRKAVLINYPEREELSQLFV